MTIDGSAGGDLFLTGGLIDLKNDGSAVSQIKFYCESSNAHAQTLIGAPHSESATNTLTLPSTGGNSYLLTAASTATVTNKTFTSPKINEDVAVTATATEINLIDGGATVGTTAIADGDGLLINDAGTMRVSTVQTLAAYLDDEITAMPNLTSVGTLTALTVDDVAVDGKVITMTGSSGDTFVTTVAANGATSLVTTDAAAAAANFSITADGTVDIDSAGVLTLDSGAAINIEPASGSAILLDGTISVDAGVVTGATSITSTAFVGGLTGNVTGNASGTALTVTQAAQTAITSVGTLTSLTTSGVLDLTGTTDASDASGDTGILRVEGGASIAKKLYVGTDLDVDGTANLDIVDIDGAVNIAAAVTQSGGVFTQDGGAVFNEGSADVDFRIESNAYTHGLFLQGSDGFVGVNINVPLDLLHLRGGSDNSSTGAPIIRMQKLSGGAVTDGDTIGGMSFGVNDDGVDSGAYKERAKIIAESANTSSGTRLEFWTGNSNAAIAENVRLNADGSMVVPQGVVLGTAIDAGDAAHTLDDYEEGTFTGTLTASSSAPNSAVTATGVYTKIGRLVTLSLVFDNVDTTGASGDAYVTGTPFTCNSKEHFGSYIAYGSLDYANNAVNTAVMATSSNTRLEFFDNLDSGAWHNSTLVAGSGKYIYLSITYQTA